jgi:hypothetical protein
MWIPETNQLEVDCPTKERELVHIWHWWIADETWLLKTNQLRLIVLERSPSWFQLLLSNETYQWHIKLMSIAINLSYKNLKAITSSINEKGWVKFRFSQLTMSGTIPDLIDPSELHHMQCHRQHFHEILSILTRHVQLTLWRAYLDTYNVSLQNIKADLFNKHNSHLPTLPMVVPILAMFHMTP